MRYACRRVALPTQRTSRPVASGSSVPVWPAFFTFARRRKRSTTSCEVMPVFLSTSNTPSTLFLISIAAENTSAFLECAQHLQRALAQRSHERQRRDTEELHDQLERGIDDARRAPLVRRRIDEPVVDQPHVVHPEQSRQVGGDVFRDADVGAGQRALVPGDAVV